MSTDQGDNPADTIDQQAADWIVRQDGDDLDAVEQHDLDIWLAVPEHRAAYERHRVVWQRYQKAGLATVAREAGLPPHARHRRRRHLVSLRRVPKGLAATAVAASIALVAVGVFEDWPVRLRADAMTGPGERRSERLADGSIALLDASSAISFNASGGRRVVRLLKGAAAFQVAPDRAHPFTVETEAGGVTALGTAFSVRQEGDAVALVVTEHSVRVETAEGRSATVAQGQGTRFTANALPAPAPVDLRVATAWTQGKMVVFNRPLGEVVAAIGRQRLGYWTVRGDAAALRVNGVYDLDNPVAALETLESTMKLNAFRISDRFIILSR